MKSYNSKDVIYYNPVVFTVGLSDQQLNEFDDLFDILENISDKSYNGVRVVDKKMAERLFNRWDQLKRMK